MQVGTTCRGSATSACFAPYRYHTPRSARSYLLLSSVSMARFYFARVSTGHEPSTCTCDCIRAEILRTLPGDVAERIAFLPIDHRNSSNYQTAATSARLCPLTTPQSHSSLLCGQALSADVAYLGLNSKRFVRKTFARNHQIVSVHSASWNIFPQSRTASELLKQNFIVDFAREQNRRKYVDLPNKHQVIIRRCPRRKWTFLNLVLLAFLELGAHIKSKSASNPPNPRNPSQSLYIYCILFKRCRKPIVRIPENCSGCPVKEAA